MGVTKAPQGDTLIPWNPEDICFIANLLHTFHSNPTTFPPNQACPPIANRLENHLNTLNRVISQRPDTDGHLYNADISVLKSSK